MHQATLEKKNEIAAACRRHGVVRLAVFGSAARGTTFDIARSDADLLVEFGAWSGRDPYPGLKQDMETILRRPVDLLDREALDESRNYIRRARILAEAEFLYEP